MDERSLLQQFIAEAEELVEALQQDIDEIAAQQRGGRISPELLNRVFRSAHSLKGMAGMAGIEPVQRAAHRFEDLLDDVRMGRVSPDGALLAECSRAAEDLAEMVGAVARGRMPEAEADQLAARIDALRKGTAGAAAEDVDALVDLDEQVRLTLTEYEEHRLRENLRERRPLYDVRVNFELMAFDKGFRALGEQLAAMGEVISTLPGAAADDPMRIAFRILYASDAPVEEISAKVEPEGGAVTLISRYPKAEAPPPSEPVETVTSVRVDLRALDDLAVLAEGLARRVADLASAGDSMAERLGLGARERFELKQQARAVERGFVELEERLVELRLVPLGRAFARVRRRAQRIAAELGREVECVVEGDEVRLDKVIVDRIVEPLAHLLNNAVDHGVEPPDERVVAGKPAAARILLRAEPRGNRVAISVSDDGRGIDAAELERVAGARGIEGAGLDVIFQPGVTTAGAVSEISGRGVGLDAVAAAVAALAGEIAVASEPGRGTTFTLTLPTTLVMVSAFFVEAAGSTYAVDVNQLAELVLVEPSDVSQHEDAREVPWRDAVLPYFSLASLACAGESRRDRAGRIPCLVVRTGDRLVAVSVDRFVEEREAVVKSLGSLGPSLRGVSGAVDVADGGVALLLDLGALVAERQRASAAE